MFSTGLFFENLSKIFTDPNLLSSEILFNAIAGLLLIKAEGENLEAKLGDAINLL